MAKKDNKAKKGKQEEELKNKKKGKAKAEPEKTKAKKVKSGEWDEQTGGGTFFKFDKGETECLIRIRSVISVGQCVFEFNGKADSTAKSGMGLVLECWEFKEKKGKLQIVNKEPAVVYATMKALKSNKDSHWAAMLKELKCKSPADLANAVGVGTVYTSDKGYMYLRKRVFKAGLAEKQACPKLTKPSILVPNLDDMTEEGLRELNPLTQVQEFVCKAVNYAGSTSEELVTKIRKKQPDFAKPIPQDKKGKKKGKGKKKKLDSDKEY